MITDIKKNEIVSAIIKEKNLLGSMNKVAQKLGISAATISHNLLKADNWRNVSDEMWSNIAATLGVSMVDREWRLVATSNLKIVHSTLRDAQREGLFMAVSEVAGSGKTTALKAYVNGDTEHSVYSIQCEEWNKKSFLMRLCKELGIVAGRYDSAETLLEEVSRFFFNRAKEVSPLLILDEADKLKPAALRVLIPLYNRLEDQIGLVVCGTENLEKEIKKGVRTAAKGYDEIDSRLGRNFVRLIGSTIADVAAICQANGINDEAAIQRIFEKSHPVREMHGVRYLELVKDLRAVKRAIKAERLKMAAAA